MGQTEQRRLTGKTADEWRRWGPYVSERAWGTVREDYSPDGEAWDFFPHDHARSRTYRWNEDGLAGICDDHQYLCFGLAFWNGQDPFLKERIFGLTGNEGNHGEDAKEYWWYEDSTPTHSWMRWRYAYPQTAFPYDDLLQESRRRSRLDPEYELLDTGIFDQDRYWDIAVEYAKAVAEDICIRITIRNAGPDTATLHALPTLWFRNVWSWGIDDPRSAKPSLWQGESPGTVLADHSVLGPWTLHADGDPLLLFCENETNNSRIWGAAPATPFPKDAINDHIVHGAETVNPEGTGTKAACWYQLEIAPGQTHELRLRLCAGNDPGDVSEDGDDSKDWAKVMKARQAEADEFYQAITAGLDDEQKSIARQGFSGMLWSKQLYHYDVERWLDGDPAGPTPPQSRKHGRNIGWRHLNNFDVISMPDKWEYPWYAAWDLGFHCVALAHVDPKFAKEQLILMCREWYMHPNGQLPAYEWSFGDVNPPVHAWAALRVFEIDGSSDYYFLERVMHKLLLNFNWWVNRKDTEGNNVFEGGFLGLDNIGPFNRSANLPVAGTLEQADGTAWMAMYCLSLLEMALVLADHDDAYQDLATKFFEHFAMIAHAIHSQGLWDGNDGFYYDVLSLASGDRLPLRVRSMVGLIPILAVTTLGEATLNRLPEFSERYHWFTKKKLEYQDVIGHIHSIGPNQGRLLSIVSPERLVKILNVVLAEDEFLSPHGIRSVSRYYAEHPFVMSLAGEASGVDYEPGESTSGLFGGNSNWRGPVWFPVNYLLIEALRRYHRFFGDEITVEFPTGSGVQLHLGAVADALAQRLVNIFLPDDQGKRPLFGSYDKFQNDPQWKNRLLFHEYFHGDTGMGLGASHQTGWTGLVADLLITSIQSPRSNTTR